MFTLINADSLVCACRILALFVLEQKKRNIKILLKYIWRQFNSEDVESSNDGGSSWYVELHHLLRVSFPKKIIDLLVSNKKSEISGNNLFGKDQLSQNLIWRD